MACLLDSEPAGLGPFPEGGDEEKRAYPPQATCRVFLKFARFRTAGSFDGPWKALDGAQAQIVDVRTEAEYERGPILGGKNIPLEELRGRPGELPKDRETWLVFQVGQRAYHATSLLLGNGFSLRSLSEGMQTFATFTHTGR